MRRHFISAAGLVGLAACSGSQAGPPAEPGPPAVLTVPAGGGQKGAAGRPLAEPVVARVTDADGRRLAGIAVTFVTELDQGSFDPLEASTDEAGEARSSWTLGPGTGTQQATVMVESLSPQQITATAQAGEASRLNLESAPSTATAGEPFTAPVVVRVEDEFGNLVSSSSVEITLSLNHGSLTGTTVAPAADGSATFSNLRIDEPGQEFVLTADADGLASASSNAFPVVPGAPPSPDSVNVAPRTAWLTVGGRQSLTATVLDAGGEPLPDEPVSWTSSDLAVATVDQNGEVTAVATGTAEITAANGEHRGTVAITVSLGEGSLPGVTSCTIGGVANLMDVFIPEAAAPRPLPVAVHVHGGGWVAGTRSTGARFAALRTRLLARGYVVVSLDYRLGPAHKYPAQIQDVKCAVRHLRARATHYGIDVDRIGAWGGSAGGQLVALLGTADDGAGFDDVGGFQDESSAVQAVATISAITDFTHPDELFDDYHRAFETWPDPESPEMIEASPVTHITPDDAPFFLIAGEDDDLVLPEQSVRMHQRLRDAGVESTLLRVAHADHDLEPTGPEPIDPSEEQILTRIVNFLDDHLQPAEPAEARYSILGGRSELAAMRRVRRAPGSTPTSAALRRKSGP